MMNYLKIWTSFREVIEPLNDGERGRLFTAMLDYAELGTLPEFKGNERFIWPSAKQAIDRAAEKADTLRRNGAKGGRPPKDDSKNKPNETKENQTGPNESKENQTGPNESYLFDKEKEKEKEKERDIKETTLKGGKEKPPARFSPPTVEEVATYCRERQNDVNPQRFVDFYAAKGWKVGNTPMKDWRAAVRTWEQRDGDQDLKQGKRVSAQMYGQRHCTEAELLAVSEDLIEEARRMRDAE